MIGKEKQQQSFTDYLIKSQDPKNQRTNFLNRIEKLLNWERIEIMLSQLYNKEMGRPSIAPLILFKMLLLQQYYNLSDPDLEYTVSDRLSFRRFAGLSMEERVPDETTMVRFRKRLIERGMESKLLEEVNNQLESKGLIVRKASIIDATIVEGAVKKPKQGEESKDKDASWTCKRGEAHYGYKAHVSVDNEHNLVDKAELTTAKTHDSTMFEAVLPKETKSVYADKAYSKRTRKQMLEEKNIYCGILDKGTRNHKLTVEEIETNKEKSKIRTNVERVFAHFKRWYGYVKVRYIGLEKNNLQLKMLAIAYNLKRSVNIQMR